MNGGWAGSLPRHRACAADSGSPSPRWAQARCAEWGGERSARAGRAGAERAAGVRGEGEAAAAAPSADSEQRADSAAAMYRHVTAAVTAAGRLRGSRRGAARAGPAAPPLPSAAAGGVVMQIEGGFTRGRGFRMGAEPGVPACPPQLPNFFLKIPDYALYAPDVEFQCQHLHLHTRGRAMYAVAVALCRALAWGYFASLRLEVLALTRHPEDWSVRARWRLTGLPLHLLLLRWYRRDKWTLLRSYDALSTFFLNSQGLIRCHRVDKLMPAPTAVPEPKKLLVAAALAVALARP
ncbi:uncharacterized protein C6orf136 homolog [Passer montanus]|uniref:uncharacterized protein C6orf136 homolog n=1 Tax=Passer montanus TaxID=9160 RepID=UPI00195FFB5A|nr:uncharacterized protein C6orf136 homolog [Passer montanus]